MIPIVLGVLLSFSGKRFSALTLLAIFGFGLSIQIGTNLINDLYDFLKGADVNRVGPRRVTQAGLVSISEIKTAIFITISVATLLGCYLIHLGGPPLALVVVVSIVLAVAYTAGPFPLAYLGLGEVFVIIFFGPVALCSTNFLLAGKFSYAALWAGISVGLISSAILVVNNIRDCDTDRLANKNTLVVRFGKRFGKIEYVCFLIAASLIPIFCTNLRNDYPGSILASLYLAPALPTIKVVVSQSSPEQLNKALAQTSLLLVLYGLLFGIGLILS